MDIIGMVFLGGGRMHNGRRRLSLFALLAITAIALAFPAGAAAQHRTVPANVLGDHVWTAELCDGTAVSVAYHVTTRGRLVFDEATGAPARVSKHRTWFRVRFDGVRMFAWVHWGRRGVLHLHVRSWSRECPPPPDDEPPPPDDDGGNGQTG